MTRKSEVLTERELRARGVYKPHVSKSGDSFIFASWPLEARIKGVFDPASGPMMNVTIVDVMDEYKQLGTVNLDVGQDTVSHVAPLLVRFHGEAYSRAKTREVRGRK